MDREDRDSFDMGELAWPFREGQTTGYEEVACELLELGVRHGFVLPADPSLGFSWRNGPCWKRRDLGSGHDH